MTARDLIIQHEGLRLFPYKDSVGILTIGVGRNLERTGISKSEALMLLDHDIDSACGGLDATLPWWRTMDPARQSVFINMTFNLGLQGFLGFKVMLELCRQGEYTAASEAMLQSKWAAQVGVRATQLATMMRQGSTEV